MQSKRLLLSGTTAGGWTEGTITIDTVATTVDFFGAMSEPRFDGALAKFGKLTNTDVVLGVYSQANGYNGGVFANYYANNADGIRIDLPWGAYGAFKYFTTTGTPSDDRLIASPVGDNYAFLEEHVGLTVPIRVTPLSLDFSGVTGTTYPSTSGSINVSFSDSQDYLVTASTSVSSGATNSWKALPGEVSLNGVHTGLTGYYGKTALSDSAITRTGTPWGKFLFVPAGYEFSWTATLPSGASVRVHKIPVEKVGPPPELVPTHYVTVGSGEWSYGFMRGESGSVSPDNINGVKVDEISGDKSYNSSTIRTYQKHNDGILYDTDHLEGWWVCRTDTMQVFGPLKNDALGGMFVNARLFTSSDVGKTVPLYISPTKPEV